MTHSYEPVSTAATAAVDAALNTRRSVRAFLPTPVPRQTIEEILQVASRAPSGSNIQPWKVTVLTGRSRAELSRRLHEAHDNPETLGGPGKEYEYYPRHWTSPYVDRRRTLGWELYRLAGIAKGDKTLMHAQHGRNYDFFDAPVGLMFTIDRIMRQGSWLDYGMFLQSIMIAARGRGLDTCPQAAFMQFHRIITEHIGAPENEQVVCGMSLGYADPNAIENTLITERDPVSTFTRFLP